MGPDKAFEILGIDGETATEAEVKKAFRTLAMTTHPDAAGESLHATNRMTELNMAYELALETVKEREDPKCVCLGFTRNPLCKAHKEEQEPPKGGEQCSECGGTGRVEVSAGFSRLKMDCPKCST